MQWMEGPLICAIIFGAVYKMFELFVRRKERLMIIDRICKIGPIEFKGFPFQFQLYDHTPKFKFTSLRLGWLMAGIGVGLIVGLVLTMMFAGSGYARGEYYNIDLVSICYVASVCLFGGIALLISYAMERDNEKQEPTTED